MDSIFNITVPGFVFFLLVVCVGYITVGNTRRIKSKGSLERLIEYVLWGIFINFIFILISSWIPSIRIALTNLLNNSGETAGSLGIGNIFEIQILLFSIGYFIIVFLISLAIKLFKKIF